MELDEFDDNFVDLGDMGLPHIRIHQDGRVYNIFKGEFIKPQKNGHLELASPETHDRVRFPYQKVYNLIYQAPWTEYSFVDHRWLGPFGFSPYWVTCDGRVFSELTGDYVVGNFSFDGYLRALLKKDAGGFATIGIHRLVAMAYIPNPENKPEVNHIDGNKLNNHVSNLEWCFGWENVEHALKSGLRKSVLSDDVIHEICRRLERGDMVKTICQELGVAKHSVLGIKSGCHARISQHYNIPHNRHF